MFPLKYDSVENVRTGVSIIQTTAGSCLFSAVSVFRSQKYTFESLNENDENKIESIHVRFHY